MNKLTSRIHKHYLEGNDAQRQRYVNVRTLLNRGDVSRRKKIAEELNVQEPVRIPPELGFKVFPPGQFDEIAGVVKDAQAVVSKRLDEGVNWGKKQQLLSGLLRADEMTLDSPQMKFIMRQDVLECISAYLGVVPILKAVDVWYSRNHAGAPSNSELFHCDWADLSQVKIFVYCTPVDASSGPLVIVGAKPSKMVREKLNYKYGGERYRVTDEEMASLIRPEDQQTVICPPGTVAFADTSLCFHYGSRVSQGASPRIATMIQFLTPTSFETGKGQADTPYAHLASPQLSQLQNLVLGKG